MTHTGGTVLAWPEPPTVPQFEWPVVVPAANSSPAVLDLAARRRRYPVPPLELSRTGRHGADLGDAAIPVDVLLGIKSGPRTYIGKARHAKPRESS